MLKHEKITTLLLKLSAPAILAMFVNALYNIIDTIFIGQNVGELGIGALSITFPIQMALAAFALMIGVGAASSVSRNLGAKNYEKANNVAGNTVTITIIMSILLAVLIFIFIDLLLNLFGATENIFDLAKSYLSIILIGFLYFPIVMASNNLIRAEGHALHSMIVMLSGTVTNIVLDYIFIVKYNMGIEGAALATIIGQGVSLLYVLYYYNSDKSSIKIHLIDLKVKFNIFIEIVTVGFATFARNMAVSLIAIPINNTLGYYSGDTGIAIYGVINRIFLFLHMPLFGIIQGMQPIAGYSYGAKQYKRLKNVLKLSLIAATIIASIGAVIGLVFPETIFSLFEDNVSFVKEGSDALIIVLLAFPLVGIQIVGASLYQALGKAIPSIFLSLLRQVIFLVPLILILPNIMENHVLGVWISFPISDLLSVIITVLILLKTTKKINTKINATQK